MYFQLIMIVVGILHVCGGDPGAEGVTVETVMYSPRMWR